MKGQDRAMKPVPIAAAKDIAHRFGYDQVVVFARRVGEPPEPHGEHLTTYGINKEHCDVAALMAEKLATFMGWKAESTKDHASDHQLLEVDGDLIVAVDPAVPGNDATAFFTIVRSELDSELLKRTDQFLNLITSGPEAAEFRFWNIHEGLWQAFERGYGLSDRFEIAREGPVINVKRYEIDRLGQVVRPEVSE
jgi:hypothetical protein